MYPFSTQNPRDFENLMSVYMDSVFSPRLREIDFKQVFEQSHSTDKKVGDWNTKILRVRMIHSHPDLSSPIIFKGVVYNEMKGALVFFFKKLI